MRVSPTKLRDYLDCARKYYYKYIEQVPEGDKITLVVGSVYHDVIAQVLTHKSLSVLEDAVNAAMAAQEATLTKLLDKAQRDVLWKEVYLNVERLYEEVLCHLEPVEVETYFFNPKRLTSGKIDCKSATTLVVDKYGKVCDTKAEPEVIDFKIKFSLRNRRNSFDARISEQLAFYAIEKQVRNAAFVEIPRNLKAPITIAQTSYTAAELEQWERWITANSKALNVLYENPIRDKKHLYPLCHPSNSLCCKKWCPYWDKCYGKEQPCSSQT